MRVVKSAPQPANEDGNATFNVFSSLRKAISRNMRPAVDSTDVVMDGFDFVDDEDAMHSFVVDSHRNDLAQG
jgi:hypothetical protein